MASAKMIPVRHGRFVVDVPEGWADDTAISLSAPVKDALAARLSPKAPPSFQSNVNVTVERLPGGFADAVEFLDAMGEAMTSAGAQLEDVRGAEPFTFAGRAGALVERKVTVNNQPVRQWTAAAFVDENVILATASTSESQAQREGPLLVEVLRRLRYE